MQIFFVFAVFANAAGLSSAIDMTSDACQEYKGQHSSTNDETSMIQVTLKVHQKLQTRDFMFHYKPFVGRLPLFLNTEQQRMWEQGHKEALAEDQACAAFFPKKAANEIRFCNTTATDGSWSDVLVARRDIVVPIDEVTCAKVGYQKDSPKASGHASTDLLGYDSWSFQHFLDGPALRIAQNHMQYHEYNATLLADIREGVESYNNPFVPQMIQKAGFGKKLQAHCGSWNTREPCKSEERADVSLGCSAPPFVPELARRFRHMMGVAEHLPSTGGFLVFAPHRGLETNNPGRSITNEKDVVSALQSIATEFGLEFRLVDEAITNSVEAVTSFWGQVKLLVAAHGGAMYNTWFMPNKAGVIEIQGNDGKGQSYFWDKAVRFDQIYAPLYATMSGSSAWESDMIVDVDDLKALTNKLWVEVPH